MRSAHPAQQDRLALPGSSLATARAERWALLASRRSSSNAGTPTPLLGRLHHRAHCCRGADAITAIRSSRILVMIAGLALAVGSAVGTNVAFLFKQRGAVLAPPVRARHPLSSAVGLFRSRAFTLGWAVAVVAWGLHVGALALAPLSIVQAVLLGGLVFLAVLAERYFGFQLGRRQWTGVIVTAAGLAVIAITGGSHTSALRHYSPAALIAVECGVFTLGAALILISMRGSLGPAAQGLLLGVAAGVLFGVSDIALKYLTGALRGGVLPRNRRRSIHARASPNHSSKTSKMASRQVDQALGGDHAHDPSRHRPHPAADGRRAQLQTPRTPRPLAPAPPGPTTQLLG